MQIQGGSGRPGGAE